MNFHTDEWIMNRVREHYAEALEHFPEDRVVGIFLQGSQNYGLDTENSDVDTKLIVVPTFDDLVFNKQPVSTTHVRANNEHIDFKDIRLMLQTFRKHNINFIEVLFTKYYIVNPKYADFWNQLVKEREMIAGSNPLATVKALRGMALEKFHALDHPYPSKLDILAKYGYDPKQLHHLVRLDCFFEYLSWGCSYKECLAPTNTDTEYLLWIKSGKCCQTIEEAKRLAEIYLDLIEKKYNIYTSAYTKEEIENSRAYQKTEELLDRVQYEIMEEGILKTDWSEKIC